MTSFTRQFALHMSSRLIEAMHACAAGDCAINLNPYPHPPAETGDNEFLLVLKPELTGAESPAAMSTMWQCLDEQSVTVGGIVAVSGSQVARRGLVSLIYPILDRVSRSGLVGCTPLAREDLRRKSIVDGMRVLGGHEFLSQRGHFSARSLGALTDVMGNQKIDAGTYAALVDDEGDPTLVLNGFYPRQMERFTAPGSTMVFMSCRARQSWRELRAELVGQIEPATASAKSIRHRLWTDRRNSGVPFSKALNAVHISAGPVEAMLAIAGIFDVPLEATALAQHVDDRIRGELSTLKQNPAIRTAEGVTSLFACTEDLDSGAAANVLSSLIVDHGSTAETGGGQGAWPARPA